MPNAEFDELAGRIEGAVLAVMHLAALLEEQNALDGNTYCNWLRDRAESLPQDRSHRDAAVRVLNDMAFQLDMARDNRRLSGHQS